MLERSVSSRRILSLQWHEGRFNQLKDPSCENADLFERGESGWDLLLRDDYVWKSFPSFTSESTEATKVWW